MSYKDLPEFLTFLEKSGNLKRITHPVSANLEITEISRRYLAQNGPALLFENVTQLKELLFSVDSFGVPHLSVFAWIVMFAPLGFVLLMGLGFQKMSFPMLLICFLAYAAINGVSFSFILAYYTTESLLTCFISSAALFGLFAVAGYFTKTDLTKLGSILMIGVIGLVIASIVNFFMHSTQMGYIISFVGVAIFTGLTAYDIQKIKNYGSRISGGESLSKISIMGALNLYIDFIMIFRFMLTLFGGRN